MKILLFLLFICALSKDLKKYVALPEFQIKKGGKSSIKKNLGVAHLEKEKYVVVWEKDLSGKKEIHGLIMKGKNIQKSEFKVNTFAGVVSEPKIISLSGKFVVIYVVKDKDKEPNGIYAQLFNLNGNKIGTEFKINTNTIKNTKVVPEIAKLNSGKFVVVWSSIVEEKTKVKGYQVFGQLFTSEGVKDGSEFLVNKNTEFSNILVYPSVTPLSITGFVVTYTKNFTPLDYQIIGKKYLDDSFTSTSKSAHFTVVSKISSTASDPISSINVQVAMTKDGFVVLWHSIFDSKKGKVYAQLLSDNLLLVESSFKIIPKPNEISGYQNEEKPKLKNTKNGFIICAQIEVENKDKKVENHIYCQFFHKNGKFDGSLLAVSERTQDYSPEIVETKSESIVVIWNRIETSKNSIYGKNYDPPLCRMKIIGSHDTVHVYDHLFHFDTKSEKIVYNLALDWTDLDELKMFLNQENIGKEFCSIDGLNDLNFSNSSFWTKQLVFNSTKNRCTSNYRFEIPFAEFMKCKNISITKSTYDKIISGKYFTALKKKKVLNDYQSNQISYIQELGESFVWTVKTELQAGGTVKKSLDLVVTGTDEYLQSIVKSKKTNDILHLTEIEFSILHPKGGMHEYNKVSINDLGNKVYVKANPSTGIVSSKFVNMTPKKIVDKPNYIEWLMVVSVEAKSCKGFDDSEIQFSIKVENEIEKSSKNIDVKLMLKMVDVCETKHLFGLKALTADNRNSQDKPTNGKILLLTPMKMKTDFTSDLVFTNVELSQLYFTPISNRSKHIRDLVVNLVPTDQSKKMKFTQSNKCAGKRLCSYYYQFTFGTGEDKDASFYSVLNTENGHCVLVGIFKITYKYLGVTGVQSRSFYYESYLSKNLLDFEEEDIKDHLITIKSNSFLFTFNYFFLFVLFFVYNFL